VHVTHLHRFSINPPAYEEFSEYRTINITGSLKNTFKEAELQNQREKCRVINVVLP